MSLLTYIPVLDANSSSLHTSFYIITFTGNDSMPRNLPPLYKRNSAALDNNYFSLCAFLVNLPPRAKEEPKERCGLAYKSLAKRFDENKSSAHALRPFFFSSSL
jgi:hypothetical protein